MPRPPRPHPLARAPLVDRLIGWLEAAWRKGLAKRPSLDPDALWNKAAKGHDPDAELWGRSQEDAADFRLRLDRLSQALTDEARLNPLGLTMAHGQLVRAIRHRLQLGRLWHERPGLATDAIAPPIIVVGHMRSGTTRVHRLLAADPAHAATRFCDSWNPVPGSPDLRPLWAALALGFAHRLDPWLDTLHPFGATRPDEELGWLATSFDHCAYEAQWHIPSFTAFSEARDAAPVYREFARLLRTDAHWHGNAARPRVLKVPQFAEDLRPLLEQFPGARIVRTTRPHDEILQSAVSLVANQQAIQSDHADLDAIERECARKLALRESRIEQALQATDAPQAGVAFSALERGWENEIARIYAELRMTLDRAALGAMAREVTRSDDGSHTRHRKAYAAFAAS